MQKTVYLAFGVVCYLIFFFTFCYTAAFLGNYPVPKTVDSGDAGPLVMAMVINVLILSLFAVQHTIMARPEFKDWWTKIVPVPLERSIFVLLTSLILLLLYWQWRPMPEIVWEIENNVAAGILTGTFFLGFGIVLYASYLINHFDLFGLRQVWLFFKGVEYTDVEFAMPTAYRYVRHPLMLGFLVAFWSAPTMSQGRLLFAVVTTGYIFFGTWMEERDLRKALGPEYEDYRRRTSLIIPWPQKPVDQETESTKE